MIAKPCLWRFEILVSSGFVCHNFVTHQCVRMKVLALWQCVVTVMSPILLDKSPSCHFLGLIASHDLMFSISSAAGSKLLNMGRPAAPAMAPSDPYPPVRMFLCISWHLFTSLQWFHLARQRDGTALNRAARRRRHHHRHGPTGQV